MYHDLEDLLSFLRQGQFQDGTSLPPEARLSFVMRNVIAVKKNDSTVFLVINIVQKTQHPLTKHAFAHVTLTKLVFSPRGLPREEPREQLPFSSAERQLLRALAAHASEIDAPDEQAWTSVGYAAVHFTSALSAEQNLERLAGFVCLRVPDEAGPRHTAA